MFIDFLRCQLVDSEVREHTCPLAGTRCRARPVRVVAGAALNAFAGGVAQECSSIFGIFRRARRTAGFHAFLTRRDYVEAQNRPKGEK